MITDKQTAYVIEYPQAVEYAEAQEHMAWTATEIELAHAYNDIKDRKGKMVDGIFVKESKQQQLL